jgi:hypothetical protein
VLQHNEIDQLITSGGVTARANFAQEEKKLTAAGGRGFDAVYDDPSIVGSAMSRAMYVMNAGNEVATGRKEGLSVGVNLCIGRRGDLAVEVVVDDHLN